MMPLNRIACQIRDLAAFLAPCAGWPKIALELADASRTLLPPPSRLAISPSDGQLKCLPTQSGPTRNRDEHPPLIRFLCQVLLLAGNPGVNGPDFAMNVDVLSATRTDLDIVWRGDCEAPPTAADGGPPKDLATATQNWSDSPEGEPAS